MKRNLSIVAAVLALAISSPASPVYWFGNGTTEGGDGTWDTVTAHFSSSQSGPADTAWNNAVNPGDPVFEGAGGGVTLGGPLTNYGTIKLNSSYTFTNSTLWMLAPNAALDLEGSSILTVSNVFAGGPLVKNGSGTLWLSGLNVQGWTSNTVLNAGTLALGVGAGANLGANGPYNHLVQVSVLNGA